MRRVLLGMPLLVALAGAIGACGQGEGPTSSPVLPAAETAPAEEASASQIFEVQFEPAAQAEEAIPAIVEAGRDKLASACSGTPDASIRIMNPLASGAFEDVPCATILGGGESAEQSSEALTRGGERIGQAQQKGVITTVACFAGAATVFLGTRYGVCPHGRTEQDRTNCNDAGNWGQAGLGFLCALTAIIPF